MTCQSLNVRVTNSRSVDPMGQDSVKRHVAHRLDMPDDAARDAVIVIRRSFFEAFLPSSLVAARPDLFARLILLGRVSYRSRIQAKYTSKHVLVFNSARSERRENVASRTNDVTSSSTGTHLLQIACGCEGAQVACRCWQGQRCLY